MKKILLIITVFFLAFNSQLFACSCTYYKKIDIRQFNNYDLIVNGQVLSVDENEEDWKKTVKIKVLKVYKGQQINDTIFIKTGLDGASCGLNFKNEEKWLIYGYKNQEGEYSTGLCSRSQKLNPIKRLFLFGERQFLKKYQNYTGIIKTKSAEGELKDGIPIDNWKYFRTEIIWETKEYSQTGVLNGKSKVFYGNGEIHYETIYLNGRWIQSTYFDKEGNVDKVYEN